MSAWKPPRQAARSVAQFFTSRLTAKILPSDTVPPEASQSRQSSICLPDLATSYSATWVHSGHFSGAKQLSSTTENHLHPEGGKVPVPTGYVFSRKIRLRQTSRKILIDSNENYSLASRSDYHGSGDSWAACINQALQ